MCIRDRACTIKSGTGCMCFIRIGRQMAGRSETYEFIAPCHFGLEACTKKEIMRLGYEISEVSDGKVSFKGEMCIRDRFYALPQSPQLLKQLLMVSGFDRYFQLARCYRDEDLRADRQPEFTQIDMELSFADVDTVIAVNEGLIKRMFKDVLNVDVELPIERMTWQTAMDVYGSDKPDLRFGLPIQDVSDAVRDTEFAVFKSCLLYTSSQSGAIGSSLHQQIRGAQLTF